MAEVKPDDVIVTPWQGTDPIAITLTQPTAADPAGSIDLTCPTMFALASVTVTGAPGEDVGLWRFGFIQLKFVTDDWIQYRGATQTDDSVFFSIDRPPQRPRQLCRDYLEGEGGITGFFSKFPFVGPAIFAFPETPLTSLWGGRTTAVLPLGTKIPPTGKLIFLLLFSDSPDRGHDLVRFNTKFTPARPNFAYSLYTGAAFATMFAVQKGPGRPITVMRSFQWNVQWRAHFARNAAGQVVQLPPKAGDVRSGLHIGHVVKGPPNGSPYEPSILDTGLPNCNAVAEAAITNPGAVQESIQWEDWKVTH